MEKSKYRIAINKGQLSISTFYNELSFIGFLFALSCFVSAAVFFLDSEIAPKFTQLTLSGWMLMLIGVKMFESVPE